MKASIKLRRGKDGEVATLDASATLGIGGEATVYSFSPDESLAAKVYLKPTAEHARKLAVMCANPPVESMPSDVESPLAWPVDTLHSADRKKRVIGYLMPKMNGMAPIINVYSLQSRLKERPQFTYKHLLRTGQNLAQAVSAVHASDYIIGDLNYTNAFVSEDARVTLIDTDSFQVLDPDSGEIYRCPVFTPDFTPPELQGDASTLTDRTHEHDLFSLSVLMFQLLMAGGHPFAGSFQEEGDPAPITDRIKDGHYPYSTRQEGPYKPSTIALPFDIVAPRLRDLFSQCFEDGHANPGMRPTAKAWQEALVEAEQDLVDCAFNQQHEYDKHLSACPWCERTVLLGGRDPFPSQEAVDTGEHIRPMEVRQTLPTDWNPEWHGVQQTRQYRTPGRGLTHESTFWVGMSLFLWLGIPVWIGIALVSPGVVALAFLIYGTMSFMVPWGLLSSVGWRSMVGFKAGSRWMVSAAAGAIIGMVLITLISILYAF